MIELSEEKNCLFPTLEMCKLSGGFVLLEVTATKISLFCIFHLLNDATQYKSFHPRINQVMWTKALTCDHNTHTPEKVTFQNIRTEHYWTDIRTQSGVIHSTVQNDEICTKPTQFH